MRQMQIADLIASANEIDHRLGPIPGPSSDRIANELRWAAAELQAKQEAATTREGEDKNERWLAPEEFAALSPRDRVLYTIKMLGSVNLTQDACNRQARRITDALESAGLIPVAMQPEGPAPIPEKEASPTQVALFLAGALHNVLAHFDSLPLDEYFAAAQSGNKFALALEKINGEASSALSVAGAHSMFAEREEQADDDGGSPADTDLLKPRGNDGVVNTEICFNALLLMGDVDIGEERIAKWSDEERSIAYDWAMRRHLAASDNDDVVVPPRPPFIPVAKFGGF